MKKLLRLTVIATMLLFASCATMYDGFRMEEDVSKYGKPDKFHYHGQHTRTYTWFCAGGMYRSYTYQLQFGSWVRTGVFHSNCIR